MNPGKRPAPANFHPPQNFAELLIESSIDGILAFDRECRYTLWNPAMERMTMMSKENVLGKRAFDVFPFLKETGEDVFFYGALEGKTASTKDRLYLDPVTGRKIYFEAYYAPICGVDGEILGGLSIIRNISERVGTELALKQSERKYYSLFEYTLDAVFLANDEGKYVDANPAACLLLGYSREELLELRIWDVTPALDADAGREMWRSFLEAGELSGEYTILRKDGTTRITEFRAVANVVPGLHLSSIRDISERKRAEEEVNASERRYRALIENSSDGIIVFDENGNLLYSSPTSDRMLGYMAGQNLGRNAFEFVHSEDINAVMDLFSEALRQPGESVNCECRVRHQDGSWRWVEASGQNLFADRDVGGFVVNFRDITERKLVEAELIQRNRALAALSAANLALTRTLELETVLETMLDLMGQLVPYDSASVLLLETDGRMAVHAIRGYEQWADASQTRKISLDVGTHPHFRTLIDTQKSILIPDTHLEPGWEHGVAGSEHIRSWLGVPLIAGNQVIGVYGLDKATPGFFGEEHIHLVEPLAGQAAVAIQNARLFSQVRAGRERLRTLSYRLVEVQEAERRQIARELHDEIGQILTGLKLMLEIGSQLPPDKVRNTLEEARQLVNDLMAKVRQLSLELRPVMLDDLGLLPALLWLFERFTNQTEVRIDFYHRGIAERRFPPEMETAIYRIIQEALTNVARHAQVTEARVQLWADQEVIGAKISDRGIGFDAESLLEANTTSGLAGMRERAVLLGGQLIISARPGSGAHLTAIIPLGGWIERRGDDRLHIISG